MPVLTLRSSTGLGRHGNSGMYKFVSHVGVYIFVNAECNRKILCSVTLQQININSSEIVGCTLYFNIVLFKSGRVVLTVQTAAIRSVPKWTMLLDSTKADFW